MDEDKESLCNINSQLDKVQKLYFSNKKCNNHNKLKLEKNEKEIITLINDDLSDISNY